MDQPIKVAFLGATGESGGLILSGLLASENPKFEVTALARPSSISKPAYEKLSSRGVPTVAVDLQGPEAEIAEYLKVFDVVIASVPPNALESQLPLARAAKLTNVKRFVPSAFAMAIDPDGVSSAQKMKEQIYAEISALGLPFTIIDVGWWYNGFIPQVPSGKTSYAVALPDFLQNLIPGDGTIKTHVVDPDNVGTFVARILADPRTLNKRVMASSAIMSFNDMFDVVEELAGERPQRKYISADGLRDMISDLSTKIELDPGNYMLLVGKVWLEYYASSFIDGDNSPRGVSGLGYLLATELYPDVQTTSFTRFFTDVLGKKRRVPYSDRVA
ncbi:hypothetical protein EDB81DRAFT_903960 [Dactylonectria macrodidyma]|uniref:NmrA-like domain-containing protein n=1 Tax=Dactylonectria macrodidyma TaxID=307937 RepID=A0A9P9EAU6_9HYPO|nr:hypothetical protein EDB81DRAFT_903960 [Dactylonectria macrodidyma]